MLLCAAFIKIKARKKLILRKLKNVNEDFAKLSWLKELRYKNYELRLLMTTVI